MRETNQPNRKVGFLLGLGILVLPIFFVWPLLRAGHSLRARALGFGWLAVMGLIYWTTAPRHPPSTSPLRDSAAIEEPITSERVAYVTTMETEEYDAPNGSVVNRIYRGQRLRVFAESDGWARVTELDRQARWVRISALSDSPPAPLPQTDAANDPRLAALPRVGEYGHDEADVAALRAAAQMLLVSGQCSRIDDANKSVSRSGLYFINCGENSNRFFRMRNGEPQFCGRSASDC